MNKPLERPLALIILDGWGSADASETNAIAAAHTPYYDEICRRYPATLLAAAGEAVGLAASEAGNAELGHMNIGAGRVVRTPVSNIREAVRSGAYMDNELLANAFTEAKAAGKNVHLVGMISQGDIHSSQENLFAMIRMAKKFGLEDVFIHGILDGRDEPPRTSDVVVEALEVKLADFGIGRIASLCGRFYAMDSSENWERTARAFTMLVHAEGERASDPVMAVRSSFLRGISDEFIAPIVFESSPGVPVATVGSGDLVIYFNHRPDTIRQLVRALSVPDTGMISAASKPEINSICLAEYDPNFGLPVAFPSPVIDGVLGSVLAANHVANFRISESDRFPHVSRFLDCGVGDAGEYEVGVEVQSLEGFNRVAEPELRSFKITDRFIKAVREEPGSVFVLNFPAPGLLAETGSFERTVEAVQYVDTCLGGVIRHLRNAGGAAVITSTHGKCEQMTEENGEPARGASQNPVPFHLVDDQAEGRALRTDGTLADVAPTLLAMAGIERSPEMTGRDLRA
ncbi:MAG: 2,3-bisphosphoglycerate-independent phosphoglycerate mutase [Acidobacteria bacterium]|nr:2,3-bisphosphoglycerate-independent phosphoglycerate mutase [Acidobacteriota bacterium]